jgi:hypothetical protein
LHVIWHGAYNTKSYISDTTRTISEKNAKTNTLLTNENSRRCSVCTLRNTTSRGTNTQADNSIEKNLTRRQLIAKSNESSSWFIEIKYIPVLRKYNLREASWYLDNSPKKSVWTSTVKRKIYEHWSKSITQSIPYYKSRQYLSCENLEKGKLHPILKINCKSKGDLHRVPIKLK